MIANSDDVFISPKEYLKSERFSAIKHEYRQGQAWAMAGSSDAHATVSLNLATALKAHLRGSGCRSYMAEMKVRVEKNNCYYYPDVMVTCDERDKNPDDCKRFPKLIVEVLSPSTEAFDRGKKFADYRAIETLQEYVSIGQTEPEIECYCRNANGKWEIESYEKSDRLYLKSVDLQLEMAEIYEDVIFSN